MSERADALGRTAQRGLRWSAVNTLGSAFLQLLQVAVLARLVVPADFGRMAVIVALLSIGTTFAEMGLSSAVIQRASPMRHEIATLYSINIGAGVTLFLLSWLAAPSIEAFYAMPGLRELVRASAGVFLIAPAGQIYRAQLQKHLEFRALALVNVSSAAAGTVAAVVLATGGAGVWALVAGYLITELLTAIGLVVAGVRRGYWAGLAWDLQAVRGYLAFGGLRVGAMMANAVNARIDQLVIGRTMGATPLGLYSVAHRLAMEPVQRVNPIVTQVAFPVLARVQQEPERLQRGYLRMIAAVTAVNAPVLVGLAATAPLVVAVFLGDKWSGSATLLGILAWYSLFRSIANASGSLVLAAGRADWSLYWNISMLFVLPVVVWIAARSGGTVVWVAAGLALTQVALMFAHYFFFVRRIIGPCGRAYLGVIVRPLACAAAMGVAVLGLRTQTDGLSPLVQLVILGATGVAIYIGCSLAWQKEVVNELRNVLPNRLRRLLPRAGDA